jgi:hypothetical protein
LYFNSGGDRASTRTDSVSICEGAVPLASTKGAANPGYCGDLDGRGASFEASSCLFPSTGVLKPDLAGLPCAGAACSPADCCVANVFINELLPTPSSAESPEWVEVFNAGETEGSLAGWTLEDGASERRTACGLLSSSQRLPSTEICLGPVGAGAGSVVWTGEAGSTIGAGGHLVAELALGVDALGETGGTVVLRTAEGLEVDRKEYADGTPADQVTDPHPRPALVGPAVGDVGAVGGGGS